MKPKSRFFQNFLAICIYEFICGYVPFGENAEDPMEVYFAIINE